MKRQLAPIPLAVCALLLLAFAAMSWLAISTKSATADEPLHALGAYMRLFHNDFRLNIEDPPLFGYWAMIPHGPHSLKVDTASPYWQDVLDYMWRQWTWCSVTLYFTPENDPDAFLERSRAMMLGLGVALGIVLAAWSWKLGGPVAAVTALTLYAFDPNFLGHAALVKNDVPITLVLLGTMMACWSVGKRAAWWNVLVLALLGGIAINTKFSGLIAGPIVATALIARALLKRPWLVMGRILTSAWHKLLAAGAVGVLCVALAVVVTWACYGFRYAPTPDPDVRLNMSLIVKAAAAGRGAAEGTRRGEAPTSQEIESYYQTPFIRAVLFADAHRLMPQAWLGGLLDTYATTQKRTAYLDGQTSGIGWWYYFPLAMLYKTPTATLAACGLAALGGIFLRRRGGIGIDRWAMFCILIPIVIYGVSALRSNLNLGLRHVFPLYPFIFMLVGLTTARLISLAPRASSTLAAVLVLGLIVESLAAFPNYIAFFNTPSGGSRGGFDLLGDSNLDWGQDLLLLKKWQEEHPQTRLYLSYFGGAEPNHYVRYTPLPGDVHYTTSSSLVRERGVAAISASNLQGMYLGAAEVAMYRQLMAVQKPIDVLGGTIYLYEVQGGASTRP